MSGKKLYRLRTFVAVFGILLFAALMVWVIAGIGTARSMTEETRLDNVKQSVVIGAVLCYSVEGVYPESLQYLRENYGVKYEEDKYLVHYRYVAADIMPSVTVILNGQSEG